MSETTPQDVRRTTKLNQNIFEKLMGDLFDFSKEDLFLRKNEIYLNPTQIKKFKKTEKEIVERGVPYQYAIGKAEFYGREFYVNKNVLIPRPETEFMIELAIKFAKMKRKLTAIDVGTGSGCVAISLANEIAKLKIYATDMSKKALEVAQKNAKFHKVKINFLKSDLLSSPRLPKKFDLILANLPYLPSADIVPENSIYYEPRLALDGGRDGLDLIKKLIIELPKRLTENGLAILEIDPRQKTKIAELAQKSALKIEFQKDLNNRTRFALLSTSSVSPQT